MVLAAAPPTGTEPLQSPIAMEIWRSKYRQVDCHGRAEADIYASWRRVARALSQAEPRDRALWQQRYYSLLSDLRFLPGGRILAGAGTGRRVTQFNCFVMGPLAIHVILRQATLGQLAHRSVKAG